MSWYAYHSLLMNSHPNAHIVYDLSQFTLPVANTDYVQGKEKKQPWYKTFYGVAGAILVIMLVAIAVLPKKKTGEPDEEPPVIVKVDTREFSLPARNSDNLQDGIIVRASKSTNYVEHVLRIFLHLWQNVKTGKKRYNQKFGAFHSLLLTEIESSADGSIDGSLIEQIHEVPRNGYGLAYAMDFTFTDPAFEFWTELASLLNPSISVTNYSNKKRKAVAIIAARNEDDFEDKKMVAYLRGVKESHWTMYDDSNRVARTGIKHEEVEDLKALVIIFHNPPEAIDFLNEY